ncbi:putative ferric-chelate reductase 1 homolog [Argopecten irradians]|uniref:putative ferric-chelate reductase 1 homolog n=1 Tax=Argopecten irradians TaxID=31199 RepID=UPI0037216033
MACVCLQLIGGLLRPSPESRVRPVFNYLHWGLGKSAQILAAVTSVIIFNTGYLPKVQEEFGTSILCFWIGVQVLWEVLFEVTKCHTSKKADKPDPTSSRTGVQTVMLWCFISTMVLMLIPAYMTIFFF